MGRVCALLAAVTACCATGCGPGALPAIAEYFGEVHVHQYQSGAHVDASFLAAPVKAAEAGRDTILPPAIPPSYESADCSVLLSPRCAEACGNGTFCAGDRCAPLVELRFADGGEVHVRGGRETPSVDLRFGEFVGYQVVSRLAAGAQVFQGGETLAIASDGASTPGFDGQVSSPHAITPLAWSTQALSWTPSRGETFLKITYTITSASNEYAVISCFLDDATGTWTMPEDISARMPSAPRSIQLEISRNTLTSARARGDLTRAVLLHTSDVVLKAWDE